MLLYFISVPDILQCHKYVAVASHRLGTYFHLQKDTHKNVSYRNSSFHAISSLVACAEAYIAELVLMGIGPTYPSERFGYIEFDKKCKALINCFGSQSVSYFSEKPDEPMAKKLIEAGAY